MRATMLASVLLLTACGAGGGGGGGGSGGGGTPPPVLIAGAGSLGPALDVTPTALPPGTVGGAYAVTMTAKGGTGTGYTFQIVTGTLPAGLSLAGGAITGTPSAAGTSAFTLKVRDSGAHSRSLDLSIAVVAVGTPLAISTTALPTGAIGALYAAPLFASGGTGMGYTWSITAGTLPTGLVLGGASISGVPLAGSAASLTLRVQDSGGASATTSVPLNVPASAILFVDGTLGVASTSTYNAVTRASTGGAYQAWQTLAGATPSATAGTTVLIRAATYTQALAPSISGSAASMVVFRAYGSEKPVITGSLDPAIDLTNRSYVVIDGLTVQDVTGWLRGVTVTWCEIRNCTFLRATATGTRGAVALGKASYNRIVNNYIEDGNDCLGLYLSDRNLVEGNVIIKGRHTLWRIIAGNYNIIRNNYFKNVTQKIGECFDFEGGVSWLPEPVVYDATKFNLIESNVFDTTGNSGNASPFAGMQYSAQRGIIRNNIFYDCIGPGLDLTLYANEARYNTDNRISGNIFTRVGNGGIAIAGSTSYTFGGQQLENNVLYKNLYNQTDFRWTWYAELDGKPVQVLTGRVDGFSFRKNTIFGTAAGDLYTVAYGDRTSSSNPAPQNLAWWQANYPALFSQNVEVDPQFTDATANDFTLGSGSPAIDAGRFPTTTSSAGSGTSMAVADAGWFCDGNGLIPGDVIQLAGQVATARVTAVNYTTHVLTLDASLTWSAGQGVARKYAGTAPDLGAYER